VALVAAAAAAVAGFVAVAGAQAFWPCVPVAVAGPSCPAGAPPRRCSLPSPSWRLPPPPCSIRASARFRAVLTFAVPG
jgi:hypothetical protein